MPDPDENLIPIGCGVQRNGETFVVTYSDTATLQFALFTISKWAANPELSFTWYDREQISRQLLERIKEMTDD